MKAVLLLADHDVLRGVICLFLLPSCGDWPKCFHASHQPSKQAAALFTFSSSFHFLNFYPTLFNSPAMDLLTRQQGFLFAQPYCIRVPAGERGIDDLL
jgi:hypothetical protein